MAADQVETMIAMEDHQGGKTQMIVKKRKTSAQRRLKQHSRQLAMEMITVRAVVKVRDQQTLLS